MHRCLFTATVGAVFVAGCGEPKSATVYDAFLTEKPTNAQRADKSSDAATIRLQAGVTKLAGGPVRAPIDDVATTSMPTSTSPPPIAPSTGAGLPPPPTLPGVLMTAAHPLNQPATQYPLETRSLLSSAVGDLSYISRPINDTWHKVFGPNHIHFSVSMPWKAVDSAETPNIFSDVIINHPSWISDDGSTCAPLPNTSTQTTHWPVLAADIEPGDQGSDGHTIVLDTRTNLLYESQYTRVTTDSNGKLIYSADATRCWHVAQPEIGSLGQNSANAAGLPILPFLLRYDEAASGTIRHAIGVTFNLSRSGPNGPYFVSPASHGAGDNWSAMTWPGQRMYLRPDYPETGLSAINVAIIHAWKSYGLVNNDNGITGVVTTDLDKRWNGYDLQRMGDAMTLNDFIVVNSGPVVDSEGVAAH